MQPMGHIFAAPGILNTSANKSATATNNPLASAAADDELDAVLGSGGGMQLTYCYSSTNT